MNDAEKPFVCFEKDCEMTLNIEDHLNWHQKKQDVMLNLGLSKNDIADQTPTPTSFIRNCEEVGLFQDLHNVNPFDEIFKKAVESAKTGATLEVPEGNSDDTLHTPHILPHVEENRKKSITVNNQDDNNSRSNEFSLNSVIPIENICRNENNEKEHDNEPIIIDDDSSSENDIKMKIKKALQSKENQKKEKENHTNIDKTNSISVVKFTNISPASEKNTNIINKNKDTVVDDTREKIREMNRAAQIRCRKRKQIRWKEMEKEVKLLREENKKLKSENFNLQYQLAQIKKSLIPTDTNDDSSILTPVLQQICPKVCNITSNPVAIQILSDTSTSTSVIGHSLSNVKIGSFYTVPKTPNERNVDGVQKNKRTLRKIVPKIVIEN